MRYSFRNTLYGLAILAAAGLLADRAFAQGTITLLADDDDEVNLDLSVNTPSVKDASIDVDVSLPKDDGLISPVAPVAQVDTSTSTPSDFIPMEVENENLNPISISFDEPITEQDIKISTEPTSVAANVQPISQPVSPLAVQSGIPVLSEAINNELFSKMSNLEKQTTLLNLELKKERIASEIAAVRAERQRAIEEEKARREEEERKRIEWQNEQDRLMVEEQRKLKEVEMALEKLRQEKIIKAYKETMLEANQKWIKKNTEVYAELNQKEEQIKSMLNDYKTKMTVIQQKADETKAKAEIAKTNHDKKVANLENQIAVLKTRLEQEIEKAKQALSGKKNPFADGSTEAVSPDKVRLSKEYAIMEITGQEDDLVARLINEDGDVFMVKVGTTLRNGYTIDEITQTFLSAVKDDDKDYLYFSAGGILDREPTKPAVTIKETTKSDNAGSTKERRSGGVATTKGIPSLGRGMIIR